MKVSFLLFAVSVIFVTDDVAVQGFQGVLTSSSRVQQVNRCFDRTTELANAKRSGTGGDHHRHQHSASPPHFAFRPVGADATNSTTSLHASTVSTPPSSSSSSSTSDAGRQQHEEEMFEFNQKLIHKMFDVISWSHPTVDDGSTTTSTVETFKSDVARLHMLGTIVRIPYFAYLCVLHLRETFGVRYDSMTDQMRTLYAQVDNEAYHLSMIEQVKKMETMMTTTTTTTATNEEVKKEGGHPVAAWKDMLSNKFQPPKVPSLDEFDTKKLLMKHIDDAFLTQSMCLGLNWYLAFLFATGQDRVAYHFTMTFLQDFLLNEYSTFLSTHEKYLKQQQPNDGEGNQDVFDVANSYYRTGNPFFPSLIGVAAATGNTGRASLLSPMKRQKEIKSLYDMFVQIRKDEQEHYKVLHNLVIECDDMEECPIEFAIA